MTTKKKNGPWEHVKFNNSKQQKIKTSIKIKIQLSSFKELSSFKQKDKKSNDHKVITHNKKKQKRTEEIEDKEAETTKKK